MYIISFTSPEATLESAGGKGANLVRLTRAGFDVPRGFVISTVAYREFVRANALADMIHAMIQELDAGDANALESASLKIRFAFAQVQISPEIKQEIQTAYADLNRQSGLDTSSTSARATRPPNRKSVAVRSSATAEDLPDLSFAGQ